LSEIDKIFRRPTVHGQWMREEYEPQLVSIIVPTYNRAHLIAETLDSVQAQTYRPIELIVVDDGSPDETAEAVEAWKNRYALEGIRLLYFQQENQGAQVARNRGIVESHGEYLQFLDSDDLLMPQKLERSIGVLIATGAAYVVENYSEFDDTTGEVIEMTDLTGRDKAPPAHLVANVLNSIAPVFKRDVIKSVGLWTEGLDIWQDTEYMFRVLASGHRGVWTNELGARVRETPGSISNRRMGHVWPRMLQWCEHVERLAPQLDVDLAAVRASNATRLASISRLLAMDGDWPASAIVFRDATSRMPWPRCWLHGIHRALMRTVGCGLMRKIGGM
jgi:glycosyltransferase involved in cell wall biosynthesis